jgi:AcrR family transcriptional regulator
MVSARGAAEVLRAAGPRTRDPDATRESILHAAQAMMAERGPVGLTVSDVARRAGVNRGTAYQHFPTREELVAEVLARQARRAKSVIDAAAPASLNDRIDQTIDYFADHPELVRVSMFRLLAGVPQPTDYWAGYIAWVERFTGDSPGRASVDAEVLSVILLGGMLLWQLGVHGRPADAAGLRRLKREIKRLLLFGAVRPEANPDLLAAIGAARPRRGASPSRSAPRARTRRRNARSADDDA